MPNWTTYEIKTLTVYEVQDVVLEGFMNEMVVSFVVMNETQKRVKCKNRISILRPELDFFNEVNDSKIVSALKCSLMF